MNLCSSSYSPNRAVFGAFSINKKIWWTCVQCACILEFYKYTSIKIKIDLQKSLALLDIAKGINSLEFRHYSIFHTGYHDEITIERRFFFSSSRDATSLHTIWDCLHSFASSDSQATIYAWVSVCVFACLCGCTSMLRQLRIIGILLTLKKPVAWVSKHTLQFYTQRRSHARTLVRSHARTYRHTNTHIEVIDLVTRCLVNANTYKWRASCRSK